MSVRDPQLLLSRLVNTCDLHGVYCHRALFVQSHSSFTQFRSSTTPNSPKIDLSWQLFLQKTWDYIYQCARQAPNDLQVVGNGDILAYIDWNEHLKNGSNLSTCMVARGALIKPWIFTEIKEQRHWDISSGERFDILKDFVRFGLQHWGSDKKGPTLNSL